MTALHFIAAGLIVVAILFVGVAIEEGLKWHQEKDADD